MNQASGAAPGRGLAISSLIMGICSAALPVPFFGVIAGAAGIVLAVIGKKKLSETGGAAGMATAGFFCSVAGIIFSTFWMVACVSWF